MAMLSNRQSFKLSGCSITITSTYLLIASLTATVRGVPVTRDVQYDFQLSVIHTNDIHARFEPVGYNTDVSCIEPSKCVGGFSRLYTIVNQLKRERPSPIILNAGDNFHGLWYTAFKWNGVLQFLNTLPIDVFTLGNHEFDDGITGVVPFIQHLKAPVVVSNIDDSREPRFQGIYNKSVVLAIGGKRIGVVGATVSDTNKISSPGNLVFLDESSSVNLEADRLVAEENVDTIIALTHCGYEIDKNIARNATKRISLIVGGHSHSFLYTGDNPPGPNKPEGDYPTVVTHEDGRKILVVQAGAFNKYVGNITLYYDKDGNIIDWDGAPIFLDSSVPEDKETNKNIEKWKKQLETYRQEVVGETKVFLDKNLCWTGECNIGSFLADVMVWAYKHYNHLQTSTKYEPIALLNAGAIRASIHVGNITAEDLLKVYPFSNKLDYGYIKGRYIVEAISKSIGGHLFQVSGLRATYNFETRQVESVEIKCNQCETGYETIDPEKKYLVIVPSFLARGGDGQEELSRNLEDHKVGPTDVEALKSYIEQFSPITQEVDGRIKVIQSGKIDGKVVRPDNASGASRSQTTFWYLIPAIILVQYSF